MGNSVQTVASLTNHNNHFGMETNTTRQKPHLISRLANACQWAFLLWAVIPIGPPKLPNIAS